MSSGNLVIPTNTKPYVWSDELDKSEFIFATYRVTAVCSGDKAALGMAMEQSVSTEIIKGYASSETLGDWTIRVCGVTSIPNETAQDAVPPYFLNTEVYSASQETGSNCFEIDLAIPARLLYGKPAQLLNVMVGELPRLGFLTSLSLIEARLPVGFGPGPAFGRGGILALLDTQEGPLLCRAMRPGVGLDTSTMARLNKDVLVGGFHLVKDDELICFPTMGKYREHLEAMLVARNEAMQLTGERKLYLANLICEPDELEERWETCCELGVDGVLVAPYIQGLGVLPLLAKQKQMPILAHNSFSDMLTRHSTWGIDDAVLCHWLRHLGADWFVTPGAFASKAMNPLAASNLMRAATDKVEGIRDMMPNIQGGKHPGDLDTYCKAVGDGDFMLIVANWVDSHPEGLVYAAKEFRDTIDRK